MATQVRASDYRARLRHWHDRVRDGEELVITDNGRPVVRVVAVDGDGWLARLERDGLLRRARSRRPAASLDAAPAAGDSAGAVSADRDR